MEWRMRAWSVTCLVISACSSAPEPVPVIAPPMGIAADLRVPDAPASVEAIPSSAGVALSSEAAMVPPPLPEGPKIFSIGQTTWVRKAKVVDDTGHLGFIRTGTAVHVKSLTTVPGQNCGGGFYEVLPHGYVCNDRTVTTELPELYGKVEAHARMQRTGPFPYRYALSDAAPMYNRIPTADEIKRFETYQGQPHQFTPLISTLRAHEELAIPDSIVATSPLPEFLEHGGASRPAPFDLVERTIPRGAMLSFEEAFEANGRIWLLSTDHTIVPADRVRLYRPSVFHGIKLGDGGAHLPLAWVRVTARPSYLRGEDGSIKEGGPGFPVRTSIELTGKEVTGEKDKRYLETRASLGEKPLYLAKEDATVVTAATDRPFAVKPGQKWIAVSIGEGTLTAYEDLTPVYSTLISPGAGGIQVKGQNPIKNSTTPLGAYTITFKDRASTMSPESSGTTSGKDRKFWIADVPHTQYFNPPFALHAAFWHERFGEPVSAGCVNLSPIDADQLFSWTDPQVPDEWEGAVGAGAPENGASTIVVVTR